jgi:hypothetical protein
MATGTLLRERFSTMRLLAVGGDWLALKLVLIPTGVPVMELSINVMDSAAVMSIPSWQLLMLIPW